jgi:hypothetical protein
MATYLWIGQPHNTTSPTTMIVDKYCWNTPGNWKLKQNVNGVLQWVITQNVPGNGDDAVIGGEVNVSGITNMNSLPGPSGELAGWEPAKCPLLFGGYSGGIGQGTWSMTDTSASGNTWTNSLNSLTISPNGYSSFNAVGGGITGVMANYAVIKDSPYVFTGITSGYYSTTNSGGFRDPTSNLRLKVRSLIEMRNWLLINNNNSNIPGNDGFPEWTGTPGTILDRFELSFDGVKAYTTWSGNTGSGSVETEFNMSAPHGANLTINGGSYKTIRINQDPITMVKDVAPFGYFPQVASRDIVETPNIGYVTINNCYMRDVFAKKACFLNISGGTAASISISPMGYGLVPWQLYTSTGTAWNYVHQPDALISCDINSTTVLNDLYSNPPTDQYAGGKLIMTADPIQMFVPQQFPFSGSYLKTDYTGITNEYDRIIHAGTVFDYVSLFEYRGQQVIVRKPIGVTGAETYSIPNVEIRSASPAGSATNLRWQPWVFKINGPAIIQNIVNDGGYVQSGSALVPGIDTIRVGQIQLTNYGCIDFSMAKRSFDDWRFGGLTGSNGNSIAGGIISADNTGVIRGSVNMKVYGAAGQISSGDVRAGWEKVYPYSPTSSTP